MGISRTRQWSALFAIFLFLSFPLATALQFSDVQSTVSDTTATISWTTDEPANSFVRYGAGLSVGDADIVQNHELTLTNLQPETTYSFTVESNGEQSSGHEFTTLAPDTTAPSITVDVPAVVQGNELALTGETEALAVVELQLNGVVVGVATADTTGTFTFQRVLLRADVPNTLVLTAEDVAGNQASTTLSVLTDTHRPRIEISPLPEFIAASEFPLTVTISEPVSYTLLVNNETQAEGEGTAIEKTIQLQEGVNSILLTVEDAAGYVEQESFSLISDTQPPQVTAEIVKGNEYFEGRAVSTITGETEPGADVYLYIFRNGGPEPNFNRAREKITANSEGKFTFSDTDFQDFNLGLEDLKPTEVPTVLLEQSVFSSDVLADEQTATYFVYLIAEDRTGKTGYWDTSIDIHTCLSTNFDFVPESVPEFQAPYRLNPTLLEQGRQEVQAVFQLNYQGSGVPEDLTEPSSAYRLVNNPTFEKACSQEEVNNGEIGCRLLPERGPQVVVSPDDSSVYVSWQLLNAEDLRDRDPNVWDDFTQNRQVSFPLKMIFSYQERLGEDEWSETKTQSSCYTLGYFVDVPIESSEVIPDWLANEGVDALNWTITQLEEVKPILETAATISWVSCLTSWFGRTIARWVRIFSTHIEGIKDQASGGSCPVDQSGLYLESTLEDWREDGVRNLPAQVLQALDGNQDAWDAISLDQNCPASAGAWKFEETIDQVYKFTCDRAACRDVPARWTEDATDAQIGQVIQSQAQCGVTGSGAPLTRQENCLELIQQTNPVGIDQAVYANGSQTCWLDQNGNIYRYDPAKNQIHDPASRSDPERGIYQLTYLANMFGSTQFVEPELLVYQPAGSQDYLVGRPLTCEEACSNPRRGELQAKGCYEEVLVDGTPTLFSPTGDSLRSTSESPLYPAGYTSDCFITEQPSQNSTGLSQCVCSGQEPQPIQLGSAQAEIVVATPGESWSYRQDLINRQDPTQGRYYSPDRYYGGRDFTAAFGTNALLDYAREQPQVARIDPHENIVASFQSLCLSGMLKHVVFLQQMLLGVEQCLVEAKYTGLQDAGMCQALFAEQVCGLAYDTIASLTNSCTPTNIDQQGSDDLGIGDYVDAGIDSLGESVDSSIEDLRAEYGNAQLNEYFTAGSRGFAQSMCLAAMGYEFPLFSEEFLTDLAYSFPMATTVLIAPARRELSSYNPAEQTAVFHYTVGANILPGCSVRNYKVSLVCVGPEDYGHSGVDCSGQQCDCVNAQSFDAAFEAEKERIIYQGGPLSSAELHDVPLETPIVIGDSHYRYDHVKIEVTLDPSERDNVDHCFDSEISQNGLTGTYYSSIRDVSLPAAASCHVDLVTGRYQCPELFDLFGFGGAYLEEPYVTCQDEETGAWMDCDTANLYTLGETMRTRVHVQTNGEGQCLQRTARNIAGITEERVIPIPENVNGVYLVPDTVGTVNEGMLGGTYATIELEGNSNDGCQQPVQLNSDIPDDVTAQSYAFVYEPVSGGVQLTVPAGVTLAAGQPYQLASQVVVDENGEPVVSVTELNDIAFEIQGFRIKNVIGTVLGSDPQQCSFAIRQRGVGDGVNARTLQVRYALYEQDAAGSCTFLNEEVAQGRERTEYTAMIRIQREATALLQANEYYPYFVSGEYDVIQGLALPVVNQGQGDLGAALALYYWIASLIMVDEQTGSTHTTEITNLLLSFFSRSWGGRTQQPFSVDVQETGEFQKIQTYLCSVAEHFNVTDGTEVCDG